jgi:hypothetical protein
VYPCGNPDALMNAVLEMTDPEVRKRYSEKSKEVFYGQDLYCEVDSFIEAIKRIKSKKITEFSTVEPAISPESVSIN